MKTVNEKKKEKELCIIHSLLDYLHLSTYEIKENERPDFIFRHSGKTIGLELVRFSPSAFFDKHKNSLALISHKQISRALNAYKQTLVNRNDYAAVEVEFKPAAFWQPARKRGFVEQVAIEIDYLRNANSDDNTKLQFVESVKVLCTNMPEPIVFSLRIQQMQWISQDRLNPCILEKSKKLQEYKLLESNADIEEYWLAIAVLEKEPFEFWDYPYTLPQNVGYDRVFLIQYNSIKELDG